MDGNTTFTYYSSTPELGSVFLDVLLAKIFFLLKNQAILNYFPPLEEDHKGVD
jgi:hypothetical protein